MKHRILLDSVLLVLFYVLWFTLTSSPEEFRSRESWLSPQGLVSYLVGYGLVLAWACSSPRSWRSSFAIAGAVLCSIVLLLWWRGSGHTGSILPFLDGGMLSAGLFIGCGISWSRGARGQSEQDDSRVL